MRTALKNIAAALVVAWVLAFLAFVENRPAEAGQAGGYPVEPTLRSIRPFASAGSVTVKDNNQTYVWMGPNPFGLSAQQVGTYQYSLCELTTGGWCKSDGDGEGASSPGFDLWPVYDDFGSFRANTLYSVLSRPSTQSDPWGFAPFAISTAQLAVARLERSAHNNFAVPALLVNVLPSLTNIDSLVDWENGGYQPINLRSNMHFATDGGASVDLLPFGVTYNTNCTFVASLNNVFSAVASCTDNGTGDISIAFEHPYDNTPICQVSVIHSTLNFGIVAKFQSVSASGFRVETEDAGGDAQEAIVSVTCHGSHIGSV